MDIPDVEAQLAAKGSSLVRVYTISLVLYIVGVLRRYHCCLLCKYKKSTNFLFTINNNYIYNVLC